MSKNSTSTVTTLTMLVTLLLADIHRGWCRPTSHRKPTALVAISPDSALLSLHERSASRRLASDDPTRRSSAPAVESPLHLAVAVAMTTPTVVTDGASSKSDNSDNIVENRRNNGFLAFSDFTKQVFYYQAYK